MTAQELVVLVLKISIFVTVFSFGLQATGDEVLYLLHRPGLLVRSLIPMFVVMPLFAILITRESDCPRAVTIALIALAISPVPPLLPRRITKAGGFAPFGLGLMVTASVLSIAFIPLAMDLMGRFVDRPFAMDAVAVAKLVGASILLPLGAGMAFEKMAPDIAARMAKPLGVIATGLLLLGVLPLLTSALPVAWTLIGNGTLLVLIAFVVVGLTIGHLLGGPDPDERVVLALCTACRHPALALAIASANFPDEKRLVGAIVLYLLLNIVVSLPYIAWQRRAIKNLATPVVMRPQSLR